MTQPQQPYMNPATPPTPEPPQPTPPYGDEPEPKWNTTAIVGFVFSFLIWIVGLIASIAALVQIGKRHERGRGLAVAGLIISIIMGLVSVTAGAAMIREGLAATNGAASPASIAAAPKKDSTKRPDKDIEKDGDTDPSGSDGARSGTDDVKLFGSMQEFADSSLLRNEMKSAIGDSFDGTGANITYRAEGDTLVMDIALPDRYAAAAPQLAQQLDTLDGSPMQEFADSLPEAVATTGTPGVRLSVHAGGTPVWDHTWTAR